MRPFSPPDGVAVVATNRRALPAVTPMTADDVGFYESVAEHFLVTGDDDLRGFLILIGPGVDSYDSPNYRWFTERYDEFLYVDRIVVAEEHRARGLGRAFYEFAIGQANGRPLLAEVNLRPRNDVSLAFHAAFGFEQVGTQRVEGGAKEVAMLCRDPEATGPPAQ